MRARDFLREFKQSPFNSWGRPIALDGSHLAAFWSWFGSSKVVDKSGNPEVVFHGTTQEFNAFDPKLSNSQSNTGAPRGSFFFSNNSGVAGSYTAIDLSGKSFPTKAETEEFYQLVKKGSFEDTMQYLHDHPQIEAPIYHDGANLKPCYLKITRPFRVNAKGDHWNDIYVALPKWSVKAESYTTNEIAQYAIENQYDGCIITNIKDVGKAPVIQATTYIVFSPQQIKSALFNKGSYNPEEHNIDENLTEAAIKVRDFKQWMSNNEGFVTDWPDLDDDIARANGLTSFVIRGNKWKKTLPNPLPLYRGLAVANPLKWAEDHIRDVGFDLGIYWTDVFEVAINQNGPDGGYQRGHDTNLVICATAEEDAVDWCATYALRSIDQEEPEIRLHKGASVHVGEILIVDSAGAVVKSFPLNKTLKI